MERVSRPAAFVLCVLVANAPAAHADTPVTRPEAVELDRDAPPPGRAELGFDAGGPVGAWAADVQLGYLDEPLVLRAGSLVRYPVRRRETLALGGAWTLGDALVLDARLPLSHQVGDRLIGLGDPQPLDRWVAGDLALGARLRVARGGALALFARLGATLPTGDDDAFAGEARWTGSALVIARASLPAGIAIAGTGGVLVRGAEVQVGDRTVGDALEGGLGVIVPVPPVAGLWCVPDQLRVAAEVAGELGDDVAHRRGPSPVEARIAVIGRPLPALAVAVRAGIGLDDQIGAPRFRALVELAWQAPLPPPAPRASAPDDDDDGD